MRDRRIEDQALPAAVEIPRLDVEVASVQRTVVHRLNGDRLEPKPHERRALAIAALLERVRVDDAQLKILGATPDRLEECGLPCVHRDVWHGYAFARTTSP